MKPVIGIRLRAASRIIYGFCLLSAANATVRTAENAHGRFLNEAPQAWLEYRRIVSRHTEGSLKSTSRYQIGEKVTTSSYECSFALGSAFQCARLVSPKMTYVCNPEYSFILKGLGGERTIVDLQMDVAPLPKDFLVRNRLRPKVKGDEGEFGQAMELACAGQMLWGGWIPLMIQSPEFRLVRVSDVPTDGGLVKVDFEFEPKELTGGNAPARSGTIFLDAKRYWMVRRAETKASGVYGQGSLSVTNEFTDDKLPVPFVSRCAITLAIAKHRHFAGMPYRAELVWHIDMRDARDLEKRQFMLTAYGLSEPSLARPSRSRFLLLGITVALLAICSILLICRRYLRSAPL
jgi:hypothetical protein